MLQNIQGVQKKRVICTSVVFAVFGGESNIKMLKHQPIYN